jgi:hypothetical protein
VEHGERRPAIWCNAEQCVSVEDEGDEEFPRGEYRIVEERPSRVGGFPVTAAILDTVGAVEDVEAVSATV